VIWVQDFSMEGGKMEEIRGNQTIWSGASLVVTGILEGTWTIRPYDTWSGEWLEPTSVECGPDNCAINLPDFRSDLALAIERS
jgi:hypothetical protein